MDKVILFAVKEDRSAFKFIDRFEMIKLGTNHIKNVFLVESGNYIISNDTFPEYFDKDKKQNIL